MARESSMLRKTSMARGSSVLRKVSMFGYEYMYKKVVEMLFKTSVKGFMAHFELKFVGICKFFCYLT
jgi:hypothetical protein